MIKNRKKLEKIMAIVMALVILSMIAALFGGSFINTNH